MEVWKYLLTGPLTHSSHKINADFIYNLRVYFNGEKPYFAWLILSDSFLYCRSSWRLKQKVKDYLPACCRQYNAICESLTNFKLKRSQCLSFVDIIYTGKKLAKIFKQNFFSSKQSKISKAILKNNNNLEAL